MLTEKDFSTLGNEEIERLFKLLVLQKKKNNNQLVDNRPLLDQLNDFLKTLPNGELWKVEKPYEVYVLESEFFGVKLGFNKDWGKERIMRNIRHRVTNLTTAELTMLSKQKGQQMLADLFGDQAKVVGSGTNTTRFQYEDTNFILNNKTKEIALLFPTIKFPSFLCIPPTMLVRVNKGSSIVDAVKEANEWVKSTLTLSESM